MALHCPFAMLCMRVRVYAHLCVRGVYACVCVSRIMYLSDGLKSRIVFALMAFRTPHLLLLDEPVSARGSTLLCLPAQLPPLWPGSDDGIAYLWC